MDSIRKANGWKYVKAREMTMTTQKVARARMPNLKPNAERSLRGVNSTKEYKYKGPDQIPLSLFITALRILRTHNTAGQRTQVDSYWMYMASRPATYRGGNSSCLHVVI